MPAVLRFDRFLLDPANRQLRRDGEPVELNGRYFDALALMAAHPGTLITKERLLDEVWRGVPVTDEALTQCVRTLRRRLEDDATAPRFIETVPKHGYRFIAPVTEDGGEPAPTPVRSVADDRSPGALRLGTAGMLGGGLAGVAGGLLYGFFAAAQPGQQGMGTLSILLVMLCITSIIALLAGAGVAFGIALARHHRGATLRAGVAGGAAGGLVVGAIVKLLGLDAFDLLLGRSPAGIAGAGEGIALGATVGLALGLAETMRGSTRGKAVLAAAMGGATGLALSAAGGRLMAGSLDLLIRTMPGSRLSLDRIGALLGELGFGPISRMVTGCLEGALFAGCIVGAMLFVLRARDRETHR